MADLAYPSLVYVHLLLFVLWLGADVGVFVLGQHFRKRDRYTLPERLVLLRLLVTVDMVPRSTWALMVPLSLSVAAAGNWVVLPLWLIVLAWIVAAGWLWLVWDAHAHDQTPRAARDRRIENWLKIALTLFYFGLGALWLVTDAAPAWLAWKALLFGAIFAAAIMIDVAFKPVGPQLGRLLTEGSSDTTEVPLLATMNRTRYWVWCVYALLVVTSWIGVVKPG
ncbi:hypothetical protein [Glacieibacterium frigidum]|uniref:Integral membrane protein n=1 Tax=Glacieibacterium frigidum TaxID=2593303 RepID=A0A552UIL1_9SPHN|nr:hypothetical protein [Glacieibacterium frigidum]TRW18030.1 hypothetical protein FMM06_07925 [Glacieibacterium frigidum]